MQGATGGLTPAVSNARPATVTSASVPAAVTSANVPAAVTSANVRAAVTSANVPAVEESSSPNPTAATDDATDEVDDGSHSSTYGKLHFRQNQEA